MANVKVFADKQMDKRIDQKQYAPDLSMHWGGGGGRERERERERERKMSLKIRPTKDRKKKTVPDMTVATVVTTDCNCYSNITVCSIYCSKRTPYFDTGVSRLSLYTGTGIYWCGCEVTVNLSIKRRAFSYNQDILVRIL